MWLCSNKTLFTKADIDPGLAQRLSLLSLTSVIKGEHIGTHAGKAEVGLHILKVTFLDVLFMEKPPRGSKHEAFQGKIQSFQYHARPVLFTSLILRLFHVAVGSIFRQFLDNAGSR